MAVLQNGSKCSHTTCMLRFFAVLSFALNHNLIFEMGSNILLNLLKRLCNFPSAITPHFCVLFDQRLRVLQVSATAQIYLAMSLQLHAYALRRLEQKFGHRCLPALLHFHSHPKSPYHRFDCSTMRKIDWRYFVKPVRFPCDVLSKDSVSLQFPHAFRICSTIPTN
jgi:hypothetical protein